MPKQQRGQRKNRPSRQDVRRILVVTEGTETEPQYVERLNSYLRSKSSTAVVKSVGVGKDPLKVVERCIEHREKAAQNGKGFDVCVCLVDVDQHATLSKAAILAKREGVLLLISNLKFEMWLRWHVENKRSALTTSQLDALTKRLGLVKNKTLSPSFPFCGVHSACEVAHQADPDMRVGVTGPNPSSSMPILVNLLLDN